MLNKILIGSTITTLFIFMSSNAFSLGTTEKCDTISPDQTVTNRFSPQLKKQVTGRSGCYGGYIVDLYDYRPRGKNVVSYDTRSKPKSKKSCESRRIMVVAWEYDGNSTKHTGSKYRWGKWISDSFCSVGGCVDHDYCRLPAVDLKEVGVTKRGVDYRIAVSSRQYSKPKNDKSSRKFKKANFYEFIRPQIK